MTTSDADPVQVAVIDDDTIVREGLRVLLPRHQVACTFGQHAEFLTRRPAVDLVILDLNLDGTGHTNVRHGAAAVADIRAAGYPVLIYTNENRRLVLAGCLAAGAAGVVHKTQSLQALADAVTAIHTGHTVITPALTGLAEAVDRYGHLPALTPRQRQVLAGRARGQSFRRIASDLGISEKMAHEHMGAVTTKFAEYLRTHSAADLEHALGLARGVLLQPPAPGGPA